MSSTEEPRASAGVTRGAWLLAAVCVVVAMLDAPVHSDWALTHATCRWTMGLSDIPRIFSNYDHVIGFGVLTLALIVARGPWTALGFVVVFSFANELSQSVFVQGHCRIWDLIADGLGLALAFAGYAAWRSWRPTAPGVGVS